MSKTRRLANQPEAEEHVPFASLQEIQDYAKALFALFEDTPVVDASDKPRGHSQTRNP